ncbi:MAG: PDZ domain-containing protein [Sulfurimonas sp.]|nr:PDZ domain-containing protein [Sulfurimonas sp.]
MLKLFLALTFFFLNLQAGKGSFDICKLKVSDSNSIIKQTLQIPIEANQRLVFSRKTPNSKIIKHDPYLSLYLIEDSKNFKYPFRLNNKPLLGTATINNKTVVEGRVIKKQIGLNSFAKYSETIFSPALLLNSCCALEGMVTPRGVIERAYIERFLKIKKVSYSDIGIRVMDKKNFVIVNISNHFMKDNKFKKGDYILELNGKKVKDSSSFMKSILFSKVGLTHKVKIKRGTKIMTFSAKSQKREGGGFLNDIFLKFSGLFFDENLYITKIEKKALKYQLKVGDKLLQINRKRTITQDEILKILEDKNKSLNLLFLRDRFQFFMTLN